MAISVNKDTCIGCGACAALCPGTFTMEDDGKAAAIAQDDKSCAVTAADSCPVQAISAE
jgi:ferredoxin